MVEVKINDDSFAYDIHSLIQAFYGGEEVQVRVGDAFTEEVPVQMAVQVTDQDISFSIIQNGAFQEKGHVYVENPDRKAVIRPLRRAVARRKASRRHDNATYCAWACTFEKNL